MHFSGSHPVRAFKFDDLASWLQQNDVHVHLYSKDCKGAYLSINDTQLRYANFHSEDEILGFTDLDVLWRKYALALMKNDKEIIQKGQAKVYLEPSPSLQKAQDQFLSFKAPLYGFHGKILGIIGLSILLNEKMNYHKAIEIVSPFFDPFNFRKISPLNTTSLDEVEQSKINKLTKQEYNCLFYAVKGLTAKQIAQELNISPRTVEFYFLNIKNKLECRSRAEMISRALKLADIRHRLEIDGICSL